MTKDENKTTDTTRAEDKAWSELTSTFDEVWDLTDRTVGKLTNLASVYHDKWHDSMDKGGYGSSFVKSVWRNDETDNDQQQQSSDDGNTRKWCHRHGRNKKDSMWAYPVPSLRQYNRCLEKGGLSAWSRDGVWRCLFPDSTTSFDITKPADLEKAASSSLPSALEERQWFSDYNVLLDWRRAMEKVEAQKRDQEWQRLKEQRDRFWTSIESAREEPAIPATPAVPAANRAISAIPAVSASSYPSDNTTTSTATTTPAKYVSESEATKQGKNIISTSIMSETISKDDGSLETKRVVKKWYDDNTVSVSETINTGDPSSTNNSQNKPKGGWFWN